MAISSWERAFIFSGRVIVEAAGVQFMFLTAHRLVVRHFYWKTVGQRRVMVIAPDGQQALKLLRKLEPSAPGWMRFVGYLVTENIDSLEQRASEFDAIMLTQRHPEQGSLIKRCAQMGKSVMLVPAVMDLSLIGARPVPISDVLILTLEPPHLSLGQRLIKRIFDLAVSSALLIFASPILLATSILIRLTSKGPVMFKQDRVGAHGVVYTMYKFRTMVANAERYTGPVLAEESDPRITRLGHLLRAARADELPQLFNVLRGDMSMVGPRPEREFFVKKFRKTVPGFDIRNAVKPGITGLAQVEGGYSTTAERKLQFDLLYLYKYSLMLDFQIMFRTVLVVLHAEQAKGLAVTTPIQDQWSESSYISSLIADRRRVDVYPGGGPNRMVPPSQLGVAGSNQGNLSK
jgi:exopolysaccharide biosynthesis polyprenyl glycosylphosphotransferase